MTDQTTEQLAEELAGARATIDHMTKAMSWISGHDRQGLDHLEEAQREARAREAAVEQARRWASRARAAETERDGAYRERAHLVAWLAALHPAVIAPAPDVDEPGWQILYLTSSAYGWQMTWHIHPRDAELFKDVEHVPVDDPRARWDGHSTEQKYNRMRTHVRVVHMNNRLGATSCPVCDGTGRCPSCHTTMRAVEAAPKEA